MNAKIEQDFAVCKSEKICYVYAYMEHQNQVLQIIIKSL